MTSEHLAPHALAEQHPYYMGELLYTGFLYSAFNGGDQTTFLLLTPGQIEHVVWKLAAIPEKELTANDEVTLQQFARGLIRARHAEAAFERGWVSKNAFFEVADHDYTLHIPHTLPEGRPAEFKDTSLRTLLGARYPDLDNLYKNGAVIHVDRCAGEETLYGTVRARLGPSEVLEIVPGGEHKKGKIFWGDCADEATEKLQMAASNGPATGRAPVVISLTGKPGKKPNRPPEPTPAVFEPELQMS